MPIIEMSTEPSSLNNLASLYEMQGKFSEAELLYQKAIAIAEKNSDVGNLTTQEYKKHYEKMLTTKNAKILEYLNKMKN
ncbi:MAG: tetratricopeptide repeat protein [Methylococcales bacterium]|nr:tetratricopeptide repeat protein [Methylococcales bacterium]MDP3008286.1 tetratricopeptide repeat protein [Methylococcales bacterium]MDP3838331.1 tetratricopeptide repeat protein [Methylococcales bacterium]